MMFNGLRGIVNISLFYFSEKIEIRRVLKKVFFLSRPEKLLIRALRPFCQDPGSPFYWGICSAASFVKACRIRSRRSFLSSYCTKINQYLTVKLKCTLFLQSNNQYLVQYHHEQTTYTSYSSGSPSINSGMLSFRA